MWLTFCKNTPSTRRNKAFIVWISMAVMHHLTHGIVEECMKCKTNSLNGYELLYCMEGYTYDHKWFKVDKKRKRVSSSYEIFQRFMYDYLSRYQIKEIQLGFTSYHISNVDLNYFFDEAIIIDQWNQ